MKLAKGLLLAAFAAVVAGAAPALGESPATLATWSLANTLTGTTIVPDALVVGDITAGNGVGSLSLSGKGYSGQGWNSASRNEDAYFEFSVTAITNWSFSPGSLSMNFRSTKTGPAKAEVRWSLDGSEWTTAGTMDVPLDGNELGHPFTVDFTGATVGSGETFAIRIYAWGASAKTGTFRIGNAYAMTLSGSVARRKMVTATVANPARIFAEDEMNEQDVVTFGFGEEGFSMPNGEEMGYLFLVPRNDSSSNLVESVVFGEDWNLGALVWTGDQTCGPFPMLFLDNNRTPTERMGYDIVVRSAQTWDEGYTADTWSSPGFDFTVTNVVPTVKRAFMGGSEVNESGNQMAGRALAGVPQVFKAETSEPSGLDLYSDSENGYGDSSKAFATKWAFALGGDRREFAVKGPPGVTALTHAFDRAGVWTVIVSMRDKDMVSDGQETWGPEFPFTVVVDAPPSVTNVVARQRWPWNGLVDVDYEVGGSTNLLAGLEARISFAASDGRSWVATNFLAGAEPSAEPGFHRATWDTAADGATNVVAAKVTATVELVREPSVSDGNVWSLIGDFNNWGGDVDMTLDDGKWVSPVTKITAGGFKIRYNHDWTENVGGVMEALGIPFPAIAGGDEIAIEEENDYVVTYDPEDQTIFVEVIGWGIVGTINSWGGSADLAMKEENGMFARKNVALTANDEIKVRYRNSWDVNYGGRTDVGFAVEAISGGDNLKPGAGTYDIWLDAEKKALFVMEAGEDPEYWGVVSTINGWGGTPDAVMYHDAEGYFVAKGIALAADDEIKIRKNSDWVDNRGASDAAPDTALDAVSGGDNIKVAAGTYDVYYQSASEKIYIMTAGKTPADAQ